jgi:hypothetical protein
MNLKRLYPMPMTKSNRRRNKKDLAHRHGANGTTAPSEREKTIGQKNKMSFLKQAVFARFPAVFSRLGRLILDF